MLDTLGCGQGCVQAQSAQGMGAQKGGAALPLGSGKGRGVGVRRRGAARGVAAQHRGSSGPRDVECTRAKETRRPRVVALIVAFIKVTNVSLHPRPETTRPLLHFQDQALTTIGS